MRTGTLSYLLNIHKLTELDGPVQRIFQVYSQPDGDHQAVQSSFPCSSVGKESVCNAAVLGLIPGLGRSPGEGNGNPLQHSCLENPMDRAAWKATVYGVTRVGHDLATKPPLSLWPS